MQHETLRPAPGALGEGTGDGRPETETADVERVDLQLGEEVEQQIGHGSGGMTSLQGRRSTVAGEIRNDERPVGAELAEATAELLRRAQETVAQHQRLAVAADKVAKFLAADRREPLLHHLGVNAAVRRDPGGQVRVKTGRLASMASLKPQQGSLRRSAGVQSAASAPWRS